MALWHSVNYLYYTVFSLCLMGAKENYSLKIFFLSDSLQKHVSFYHKLRGYEADLTESNSSGTN